MRQQDQNKLVTEFPHPLARGVGANILSSLHALQKLNVEQNAAIHGK